MPLFKAVHVLIDVSPLTIVHLERVAKVRWIRPLLTVRKEVELVRLARGKSRKNAELVPR